MQRNIIIAAMITISSFSIALYTGCTKTDSCDNISCKNGGTCVNGACNCPTGYTGTLCETKKCEANNTASVRFINKTGTSQTYSVVWDGSVITTLGPGATSEYYTVAAGQHTLHFMISNSGTEACTQSTPNLAVCSSMEYWCTK
ncbi:MAG: calcium-binding EGF-like domain-containing protein [Chitinophagaceae bacterium]|nr:calcium-binding EGF-like domain-containing protein [Chitinophagaceae bacterium]MCB9045735.1 calcium-binding EGF-like domain-containing protein [Chitinophagales bacterium]